MGILVIPGLAFCALLLAPFFDNGTGRIPQQRPIAVSMILLVPTSGIWLTYTSATNVDWEARADEYNPIPPSDVEIDKDDPGYAVYENSCMSCHGEDLEGTPSGPG